MIEIRDLFVLYRGAEHDVVALRGLSLTVDAGERVVVNGPSGSGKSTLIKVVTAEVTPGAGRAVVLGHDVGQMGAAAARVLRRERIGIITQGSGRDLAPELTCLQNVAMQARLAGASAESARSAAHKTLGKFDVAHLAERYPATLSGGEAQRVGVAAALASGPGLIVADEPTGELDRANADIVYDLLAAHAAASGAGLLVVTHDVRANRIADRVITIRDGRVSSELVGAESRLIVDQQGWVRLPEADRHRAGITGRATVGSNADGVILTGNAAELPPAPTESSAPAAAWAAAESRSVVVTATDVSFSIGATTILASTSFTIRRGALTVLAGPSGSGKTTLLGLLGQLGDPTAGRLDFGSSVPTTSICSSLAGFAEQASPQQNLVLARSVRGLPTADVVWALRELGMEHLADRPMSTLSGGERQRVGVARALVTEAELVLLDEPTSQLDEANAAQLAAVLQRLTVEGRTIVCTSHDPAIVSVADVVVSLGQLSA
jgi:ABC-type lipoprotein export system ATPase subunit